MIHEPPLDPEGEIGLLQIDSSLNKPLRHLALWQNNGHGVEELILDRFVKAFFDSPRSDGNP
jgi:hypothetical protein